ncbi:nuclear transport factor 2 family protein, partial [Acinetobacter baumannii]
MTDKVNIAEIIERLERLEAHNAIRNCINRYMEICDELNANTDLYELMNLFDQDCIWEGIGDKYSKSFGRYDSWQSIYDMFKRYTQKESHFVMNAHFVNSEQIYVNQNDANA